MVRKHDAPAITVNWAALLLHPLVPVVVAVVRTLRVGGNIHSWQHVECCKLPVDCWLLNAAKQTQLHLGLTLAAIKTMPGCISCTDLQSNYVVISLRPVQKQRAVSSSLSLSLSRSLTHSFTHSVSQSVSQSVNLLFISIQFAPYTLAFAAFGLRNIIQLKSAIYCRYLYRMARADLARSVGQIRRRYVQIYVDRYAHILSANAT